MDFASYQRERYNKQKQQLIEMLGGVCVRCKSTNRLEVDHIDYKTKSFDPLTSLGSRSLSSITTELEKCQLLCRDCHVQKSIEEQGRNTRHDHGTFAAYRHGKCRCSLCREANKLNTQKYRDKRRCLDG